MSREIACEQEAGRDGQCKQEERGAGQVGGGHKEHERYAHVLHTRHFSSSSFPEENAVLRGEGEAEEGEHCSIQHASAECDQQKRGHEPHAPHDAPKACQQIPLLVVNSSAAAAAAACGGGV